MACATPLGATIAADRRKVVTVLFADMKGSTALGERLEPEALRGIMTRFYASARGILERHGGTVEKFIGDAVMCVFGVPRVHEDDALRACRAATGLRDAVEEMNAELFERYGTGIQIRTGVNTGEVVSGDPASGASFVSGDAVNVAARFEQSAEPGEILIGEATRTMLGELADVEPVEPLTLKGKAESVPAFRLLAVRDDEGRGRMVAPLIGRDRERGEMLGLVTSAGVEGAPRVVVMTGAPGIGKSRLLEDLRFGLEGDAFTVAVRCGPERSPAGALLVGFLGGDPQATDAVVAELLEGREQASVVADAVRRAVEGTAEDQVIAWVAEQLLSALATARPLVAILDDAHLADPGEVQLAIDAVRSSAGPTALVVAGRPELLEGLGDLEDHQATLLSIGPLPADALGRLAEHLLGGAVEPRLRARVVEAAGGNPLFLGETLRMLLDADSLRRGSDGGWEATGGVDELAIPTTVRAVLSARVDLLPDAERAALDAAAILGSGIDAAGARALVPELGDGAADALGDLARRELLAEATDHGDAYRFRQASIRDVAAGLLTREAAATLHERAAAHLADVGAPLREVAEHLEQALALRVELGAGVERDLAARTVDALVALGEEQLARGDGRGAAEALERAVSASTHGGDLPGRARVAALAYDLGDWDRVIARSEGLDRGDAEVAARLGVALTRRHPDDPARLAEGRALLEFAVERGADADAAAALAGSWKGVDEERAHDLYRRAHELDPSQPYALGNLLEYEVAAAGDLSPVDDRAADVRAAAERCAEQAAAGENLPWAWFDLAKFRLMLRDASGALTGYATAIGRSVAGFQVETSRASLDRLARAVGGFEGLEECRRLLTLGEVARFGEEPAAVRELATPVSWPLAPPVAILAGGSSDEADERIRGYEGALAGALAGWPGTVVSGGTRQGVSAIAGDLGSTGVRVIGYLPAAVPDGVEVDDDPGRYAELRRTDGNGFGAREPIRYWADVLTSGIDPSAVRVIALGGGTISAFEYRLAAALGAHVGAIRGSGDAAHELLSRSSWSASGRVEELEPTAESVRAFLTPLE
jgi:class 3 adenylate cyclase